MTTFSDPIAALRDGFHDHRVQFYDTDAVLLESVRDFIAPALAVQGGGAAIVVATQDHRQALVDMLVRGGVAVPELVEKRRLIVLDADATLAQLMVDGSPNQATFRNVIGGLLDSLGSTSGPIRVYGEMVALLWERGLVSETIALEDLWNGLAATHEFGLLCGYPVALFSSTEAIAGFDAICSHHGDVTLVPLEAGVGRTARWRLPSKLTSGAEARRQLRTLLAQWGLAHLLDDAELLATELINNAVIHAQSPLVVRVEQLADALRVEVTDFGTGTFSPRVAESTGTTGRGLMLTDALSASWGTSVTTDAKTVWFELTTGSDLRTGRSVSR